jgi:hypothetical protein
MARQGIYKNITTSPTETTLIARGSSVQPILDKILISNFSDDGGGATVNLFLEDASDVDFYFFKNVVIPKGATLVFDDNFDYDKSKFALKLYNTGTSPAITVIIKFK